MSSLGIHDEQQFYRIVANVTPVTHPIFGEIPNKGTIPLSTTKTGTITSTPTTTTGADNKKIIFGTDTLFKSEVREGDYLHAADVVRKIVSIASDTQLTLDNALPANISGVAFKIVRPRFRRVRAKNTGSVATAIYQEAKMGVAEEDDRSSETALAPVSYDVSSANQELTFSVSE